MSIVPLRALLAASLLGTALSAPGWAQNSPARAGDRVLIRIVRDSAYTDTLRIDADGMAVLPLAGDVRLGDVAGNAVQDTVRARLARFVNPSAVEATLLRRVRVVGDVNRAGVFYVDRTFTIRDAMAMAEGAAEWGDEVRATLDRAGARHEMKDWRSDVTGTWHVESGDQLLVRRLPWYRRNIAAMASMAASIVTTLVLIQNR